MRTATAGTVHIDINAMNLRCSIVSTTVFITRLAFIQTCTIFITFIKFCIGRHKITAFNAATTTVVRIFNNLCFATVRSLAVAIRKPRFTGNAANTAGTRGSARIGKCVIAGILAGTAVSRTRCG